MDNDRNDSIKNVENVCFKEVIDSMAKVISFIAYSSSVVVSYILSSVFYSIITAITYEETSITAFFTSLVVIVIILLFYVNSIIKEMIKKIDKWICLH